MGEIVCMCCGAADGEIVCIRCGEAEGELVGSSLFKQPEIAKEYR